VQIEVFSDVVCPWCYIGKRRLEEALAGFDHTDQVTVTYRSFQLDPSSPDTSQLGLDDMLAHKYGRSIEQARAMNDHVSTIAASVGLLSRWNSHGRRTPFRCRPTVPEGPATRGRDAHGDVEHIKAEWSRPCTTNTRTGANC
jgi:predicted DsbA family dithiol-disulfide isomerase